MLFGLICITAIVACGGQPSSTSNTQPSATATLSAEASPPVATPRPPAPSHWTGYCPIPVTDVAFPQTIPTYPQSALLEEHTCTASTTEVLVWFYRRWSTLDSQQQVIDFYKARLSEGTWAGTVILPIAPQSDGSVGISFATAEKGLPSGGSVVYSKAGSGGVIEISTAA